MKILGACISTFPFSENSNSGLITAARAAHAAMVLHHGSEVELTMIGNVDRDPGWYRAIPLPPVRQHQAALFDAIRKETRREKYDLVYLDANFYMMARAGLSLAPTLDVPVAVFYHDGFGHGDSMMYLARENIATAISNLAAVAVPCWRSHLAMCKYFADLGHPVDPGAARQVLNLPPFAAAPFTGRKEKLALIVGRLDAAKNPVNNLQAAIRDARQKGYRIELVMNPESVLGGESRKMVPVVLSLIEDNRDIITHRLSATRSEVQRLMQRARILYQFSRIESQSMVAMEANSFGCVVAGYESVLDQFKGWHNILIPQTVKLRSINFIDLAEKIDPGMVQTAHAKQFPRDKIIESHFQFRKDAAQK